jgi:hypothetical protein
VKKHRLLLLAAAAAGMLSAHSAFAQVFGQYGGAQPIPVNTRLFGVYTGFTQSESELIGQLRLSFYPGVDFGFQGGMSRVSVSDHNRTAVKIGVDFKAQVLAQSDSRWLALSLGGALGVSSAEDFNLLSLGPQAEASHAFRVGSRSTVTAYTGAVLLFTRSDLNNSNDTDVSCPIRFGAEYALNPDMRFLAELQFATSDQINDDVKLILGANFPF